MIILLLLLFIMTMLKIYSKEGFIDNNTTTIYTKYKTFYNMFMPNWIKAITTSYLLEKNPKDNPSKPTIKEMNDHIRELSKTLHELPDITNNLPDDIDDMTIQFIKVPLNATPYINALTWMNKKLLDALGTLKEPFECENVSNCKPDKPGCEEINKCIKEQQKNSESTFVTRVTAILSNPQLKTLFLTNLDLLKKAEDVQKRAQSGQLAGSFKSDETGSTYSMPEGGDTLSRLRESDPAKYAELSKSPWFDIKNMFEQINATVVK